MAIFRAANQNRKRYSFMQGIFINKLDAGNETWVSTDIL